jgi:hypothetical protein
MALDHDVPCSPITGYNLILHDPMTLERVGLDPTNPESMVPFEADLLCDKLSVNRGSNHPSAWWSAICNHAAFYSS